MASYTAYRRAKFTIPLDIPDVEIISTKTQKDGKFLIEVETLQETTHCGVCKQAIKSTYGHGKKIVLRHLPILKYETYICVRPKRGQCKNCLHMPTTTQLVPWYVQKSPHTTAYDEYLMKLLIGSTVQDVSLKENVGYDAILGTLKRRVPAKVEWENITHLGTVGIDEISLKKGHKDFAAILTARQDDGTVRVLAVLKDRKKKR